MQQPQRLVAIAFDRRGLPLGGVADEMMRLTLHRAKTRHLPHQPLLRLAAATRIFGKQLPALLGEIEQDRPALEYGQRRTAADGLMVDDRGQAAIGVDRSEEHTSELQSLMRISYAVFCLKTKQKQHIRQ